MPNDQSILSTYKRIVSQHPLVFSLSAVFYVTIVAVWVVRQPLMEYLLAPHEEADLRARVVELEDLRRQQDQLLSTFTSRTTQAEFLKPLKFEERWRDDRARETVGRLVEYAEFAISKNDFEHAERFYSEANEVQPTITIPYYEGRLAYRRGDFQRAETKWLEAIKRDTERKSPDLRLYLGILYYQMGRLDEAKKYLRDFESNGAKPLT
jgi:tetratricopeptide (TPR) repeat protein